MLKSSGAMALATLTSRLLGMLREMAYASFMGVGWVTDAFMLAFMIPNLFRRLLGEGALTAAFIPVFKEKEKLAGEKEMWRAANAVISGSVLVTCAIVLLGLGGISVALPLVERAKPSHTLAIDSVNATDTGAQLHRDYDGQYKSTREIDWQKTVLMLRLLRAMFPYLVLVSLAAIFMGMLNARGHFFIPAMGAGMLNVVMIASVFLLAPRLGTQLPDKIFGLAVGVLLAGLVQAGFQLPVLWKDGFQYHWVAPWKNETVRHVARQMIPGTIGVAAFQINVLLTTGMGFFVGTGIISSFNYAVRLMELPQGVFGISLATYLLPTLSGLAAEKNYGEFRATLRQGVGYLVTINLLATVFLLVLAEPMIRLLFQHGNFHAEDTRRAAFALVCLAPGLVVFSLVNILARAFYALGDTKTPMRISIFCLVLNILIAFVLVWPFEQGGLGLANSISAACNALLLTVALRKKLGRLEMAELRKTIAVLLAAAALGGIAAWGAWEFWETRLGHGTLGLKLGAVFVPMGLGTAIYFGIAMWLRVPYVKEIFATLPIISRRLKG
jgi:putative peptidoglycan lipid II flippase